MDGDESDCANIGRTEQKVVADKAGRRSHPNHIDGSDVGGENE